LDAVSVHVTVAYRFGRTAHGQKADRAIDERWVRLDTQLKERKPCHAQQGDAV